MVCCVVALSACTFLDITSGCISTKFYPHIKSALMLSCNNSFISILLGVLLNDQVVLYHNLTIICTEDTLSEPTTHMISSIIDIYTLGGNETQHF